MSYTKSVQKIALDLLSRREHSHFELMHKLSKRSFSAAAIIAVLEQLESENLLSDARFTEAYISMRSKRGYGPERIKQELQARGVSAILVNHYTNTFTSQWKTFAAQARQKKFGTDIPADFASRIKQIQFLRYRGFTNEQINTLMNKKSNLA